MNKTRNTVIDDHKIKNLIEKSQLNTADILLMLKDSNGVLDTEIDILGGRKRLKVGGRVEDAPHPDPWHNFYSKLKDLKQYHGRLQTGKQKYSHKTPEILLRDIFKTPNKRRKLFF